MKKLPITIAILVIISIFASSDVYINKIHVNTQANRPVENQPEVITVEKAIDKKVSLNQIILNYQVEQQFQVNKIFKKLNLKSLKNLQVYQNQLSKIDLSDKFYLYEIIGPENEEELTYLNIKLQALSQINNTTQTINETNSFGEQSFFFNDADHPETAHLLIRAKNSIIGFEYGKENTSTYEDIKKIITHLNINN